jgi:hypothetical protein
MMVEQVAMNTLHKMRRAEAPDATAAERAYVETPLHYDPDMRPAGEKYRDGVDVLQWLNSGARSILVHKVSQDIRSCGFCSNSVRKKSMLKCGKCKLMYFCDSRCHAPICVSVPSQTCNPSYLTCKQNNRCQEQMKDMHKGECDMFAGIKERSAPGLRGRLRVLLNTLRVNCNETVEMFDAALCAKLDHGGKLWHLTEIGGFFRFTHASPQELRDFCNGCDGGSDLVIPTGDADTRVFFSQSFGVMLFSQRQATMLLPPVL